ncbi:MAG: FAD-dependent decaprenylphosphoryl-beta-D-ribofuranose 2-oxidase [Chlamydiae bacterium]|nr:FAD-dependent decaprenylphosphoryl-beta-D-ribofuranose 2-oxidase [Chlamydiota bacterium]
MWKKKSLHDEEVGALRESLRDKKEPLLFERRHPSNALRTPAEGAQKLDITHLNKIIAIDREEQMVWVEPGITFKELCEETLPHGLVPPVVTEFQTISLGGAIQGTALESSSHKFGQVADNCLAYEAILGNGELLMLSPEEHPELFYALSGSYRTLAIITLVKLKLRPAKKYVHLTYHHFSSTSSLVDFLNTPQDVDFVEGIWLSPESGIAITGRLTDEPQAPLYRQKWWWSTWFIQHVSSTKAKEETMKLEEYLFRYDRGAFWMARYLHSIPSFLKLLFKRGVPDIKERSLNPGFFFRFAFGWNFSSETLYKMWHRLPKAVSENLFFVHDYYIPVERAEEALNQFQKQTGISPIWLCPIRGTNTPQILSPHYGKERFLNLGFYGVPKGVKDLPSLSAELEKEVLSFGGKKMLYSYTYYDKETFYRAYYHEKYQELRERYHAENRFPPLYNKVKM